MGAIFQVLVGGPTHNWPHALRTGKLDGRWAAADRGALRLLQLGYHPELVVGDFDSMTLAEQESVFEVIPKIVEKPDQMQTDLQLLLTTLDENYDIERIDVYGATGGRLDQLFSNVWILAEEKFTALRTKVRLIDRDNVVTFFNPGAHTITKIPEMKYLGFMPLTPVTELNLLDEKYPLAAWSGNPVSWSSNEFNGSINHFSFETGIVAVIQSRDSDENDA